MPGNYADVYGTTTRVRYRLATKYYILLWLTDTKTARKLCKL
jgi:hypothetical protein